VKSLGQPMVNHFDDMEIEDSLFNAFEFLFFGNDVEIFPCPSSVPRKFACLIEVCGLELQELPSSTS